MKWKTKNTIVRRVPKSDRKIVERDKIHTPEANTQIHDDDLTFQVWFKHFNKKWQIFLLLFLVLENFHLIRILKQLNIILNIKKKYMYNLTIVLQVHAMIL